MATWPNSMAAKPQKPHSPDHQLPLMVPLWLHLREARQGHGGWSLSASVKIEVSGVKAKEQGAARRVKHLLLRLGPWELCLRLGGSCLLWA